MTAIRAAWINGHIVPTEPVDWPEGIELRVEPISAANGAASKLADQEDDPDSVADWIASVEKIQPLIWAEGEWEEYKRFREKSRQFNLEAVRQQMEQLQSGDAP